MLLRHTGFRRLCLARDMLVEASEAPRSIADIAGDVGVSPSHLIRQFEAVFGITPHQNKALRFYTDVLGFKKKTEIPVGAFRWLTVVSPEGPDDLELSLEPNANPAAKTFQEAMFTQGIARRVRSIGHQRRVRAAGEAGRRVHLRADQNGSGDDRDPGRHVRESDSVVSAGSWLTTTL